MQTEVSQINKKNKSIPNQGCISIKYKQNRLRAKQKKSNRRWKNRIIKQEKILNSHKMHMNYDITTNNKLKKIAAVNTETNNKIWKAHLERQRKILEIKNESSSILSKKSNVSNISQHLQNKCTRSRHDIPLSVFKLPYADFKPNWTFNAENAEQISNWNCPQKSKWCNIWMKTPMDIANGFDCIKHIFDWNGNYIGKETTVKNQWSGHRFFHRISNGLVYAIGVARYPQDWKKVNPHFVPYL